MISIEGLALAQKKARRSPAYADIAAHLARYVARVVAHLGLDAQEAWVLDSETNVTLRIHAAGGPVVLKISPVQGDLGVSAYFYQLLMAGAPAAVPVPRVLLDDATRTLLPYEIQVLEWLEGTDARALPVDLHSAAGQALGRGLRTIHGLAADGFGRPHPGGGWSAPTWHAALREAYAFVPAGGDTTFSPGVVRAIERVVFHDARTAVATPQLLHGDVVLANALFRVEDGRVALAGIIDPGRLVGGDPMFDLAGGTDTGDLFARGVWEGYTTDQPLSVEEEYRYRRLLLLSYYTATLWHGQYGTGHDAQTWRRRTLEALGELETSG